MDVGQEQLSSFIPTNIHNLPSAETLRSYHQLPHNAQAGENVEEVVRGGIAADYRLKSDQIEFAREGSSLPFFGRLEILINLGLNCRAGFVSIVEINKNNLTTPDDLDERGHMTETSETSKESIIPSDLGASPPKENIPVASLDDKLREARSDILGVVTESVGEFCLRLCEVISLRRFHAMRVPDLTLCGRDPNGGKEEVVIVEVKGPRDKLSGEQIAWITLQ
ncbi:hypothetical protein BLNAU_24619 [Blattamonas nauphoetae]|uniref:VRR-NUC domain-containing protein n=1 Tax=Blattamonas nauphoetae TaxID=2049346 RepID=A0ABQ9WMR7_9EUKA|nr:hypothetical protein BLNAU_24619 [Blattamonas nauphoetae]